MKNTKKIINMNNKNTLVGEQKELELLDIKIDIKKILGLDEKVIPNPKSNGDLPVAGSIVTMVERKFFARVKYPTDVELGEYRIKRITKCLVECEKITKSGATYSTSFKVSDFKAGLVAFKISGNQQKAFA